MRDWTWVRRVTVKFLGAAKDNIVILGAGIDVDEVTMGVIPSSTGVPRPMMAHIQPSEDMIP